MSVFKSWTRGHAALLFALALVACGGGSAVLTDSASLVGASAGTPEPVSAGTTAPATTGTTTSSGTTTTGTPLTSVLAPLLSGLSSIASNLDINANLQPSWGTGAIPGPEAPGVEGAFRFLCAPSHNAYNDPIVYPGQPGKSHLHTFFGNTGADANSTYNSLRTSGDGTCNNLLNRSAYWVPAMMHPSGKVIMPNQVGIYYKRAPQDSIYCAPPYAKACIALPRGLRYIFGYNMANPAKSDPADKRWFNCDGNGAVSGHFDTIKEAAAGCPTGASFLMVVVGPNCWNGTELDTADHRSHMAYQYYDGTHGAPVCPATHPYLLPFFELIGFYQNDGTAAQWKLASDVQMGTEGGVTAHADWFGAWEDSIQDMWTANCIDKALNCSGGDLGNGKQLTTKAGYSYPSGTILVDAPEKP